MTTKAVIRSKTYDMVYIGVFAVFLAICSWISIPSGVPFTLQTFGVFLAVGVLGGKRGTAAVVIYLLLGLIGLPVFAGFTGGLAILTGTTGGYLIGFVFSALFMWGMEKILGRRTWAMVLSMGIGMVICYAFGTAWFMFVYMKNTGAVSLMTVLAWCVVPFIIPDIIKIALALALSKRLSRVVRQ